MILVIYKAHFISQYQIVIISNSWKWFFVFCFRSRFDFNLCIWLSVALFSFFCVHIYCECKWVSRKIMCNKNLFPANSKSCTKRNAFSQEFLRRKSWCIWEEKREDNNDDNAFCASLTFLLCSISLPEFTFLLLCFLFLIDYFRNWEKVKKKNCALNLFQCKCKDWTNIFVDSSCWNIFQNLS